MDASTSARIREQIGIERARTAPPEGFPPLPPLPAGRYVDPLFHDLETRWLWPRCWLLAGHADQLPDPGSYFLWRDSGVPIVVLRDGSGVLRAFYNTCQHRGAPLVREPGGRLERLRCPYHSWTYNLAGELVGVPDERDFRGLDRSRHALVPVRCESWGGWIFVCRDEAAASLRASLGAVADELSDFGPDTLHLVSRHSIELACNWKVAMDAFLEVYHLKHVHPRTVSRLLDHSGAVMGLLPHGHSRMATPLRDEALEAAGRVPPELVSIASAGEIPRITNLAYHVFPNLVTPLDVTGFPFLVFWPQSLCTTRMDVLWFGPERFVSELPEAWQHRLELFDVVLEEDTRNLAGIQTSLESPAFRRVTLGYQERRIYHLHEEIDRRIGEERIPDDLRVASLLAPFVERA